MGPVRNAVSAIKIVTNEPPEGVLLDVKLQETNGSKVAEYLQSKKIPFLLSTGYV